MTTGHIQYEAFHEDNDTIFCTYRHSNLYATYSLQIDTERDLGKLSSQHVTNDSGIGYNSVTNRQLSNKFVYYYFRSNNICIPIINLQICEFDRVYQK